MKHGLDFGARSQRATVKGHGVQGWRSLHRPTARRGHDAGGLRQRGRSSLVRY